MEVSETSVKNSPFKANTAQKSPLKADKAFILELRASALAEFLMFGINKK